MIRKLKILLNSFLVIAMALMITSCGKGTGVCTACCSQSGITYCKDNWTEDECADWNTQQVNGVQWHFHKGQTCEERGTPATP
jgi:hypothetical protein